MRKTRQNQEVVPNVKQIEYRKRRGEKISFLIQREQKLAEGDEDNDFWNNNKYFNDGNMEDDDESFKEKGDEKMDSYDSDFGQTTGTQQEQEDDSSVKSTKKVKFEVKANKQHQAKDYSAKKYYIHDHFNQEYLIREAVMTEEHNKQQQYPQQDIIIVLNLD